MPSLNNLRAHTGCHPESDCVCKFDKNVAKQTYVCIQLSFKKKMRRLIPLFLACRYSFTMTGKDTKFQHLKFSCKEVVFKLAHTGQTCTCGTLTCSDKAQTFTHTQGGVCVYVFNMFMKKCFVSFLYLTSFTHYMSVVSTRNSPNVHRFHVRHG